MKTLLIGLENASTHRYNLLIFRLDPIYLFRVQLIQWTGLLFQYRMAPKPNNVVLYFLIGNSLNLYLLFFGIHSHILNLTAFIWQCELKIALLQISNILYYIFIHNVLIVLTSVDPATQILKSFIKIWTIGRNQFLINWFGLRNQLVEWDPIES